MFTDGVVNGRHNLSPELNGADVRRHGRRRREESRKARRHHHHSRAGVVHGEHVDHLSFRPSPGILMAGWVHPVLKK